MYDDVDKSEMCCTSTQNSQKLNILEQILSEFIRKELINRKDEL